MSASGDGDFILGAKYTDTEWAMVTELAERLGLAERVQRTTPAANADLILDALGYSAAWSVDAGLGGLVQQRMTSCRRCGALLALRKPEQGHLAAVDQHTHWHARIEGVTPNGRQVR